MTMRSVFDGIKRFQREVFPAHQARFKNLATRQCPRMLLITCADSRIDPNLLTQSLPGDLFHVRNAGNIVPPHPKRGGEAATIEYAVRVLGIRNVLVCGHTDCGAMKALLQTGALEELPAIQEWIETAAPALTALERHGLAADDQKALRVVTEENVLVQMEHLRTHPAISGKGDMPEVRLYGALYEIDSGNFLIHDPDRHSFVPINEFDSSD